MKAKKLNNLLLTGVLLGAGVIQGQSPSPPDLKLIRQKTVTYLGVTDTIDLMPIIVNTNGNVVVSGNQKMNATQYNATTIEQFNSGLQNWINQYNPGGVISYVAASCRDNAGFVYNVGGMYNPGTNSIDYMVVKLNAAGNVVWSANPYNGPNGTIDVAIAVCLDPAGNLYVTGASDGTGTALVDYATIKYGTAGNQIWVKRYDNNNNMDIPTSIVFDAGRIKVSGASGTSLTNYDFYTVSYDAAGNTVATRRTGNSAGQGQDKPFGLATDGSGNIYIAGTTYNGTNYDAQLVKLDSALNQIWVQPFDGHGFDDAGIAVKLDNNGDIVVTGSSYLSNGTRELFVLKYDASGNQLWKFQRQPTNGQNAEGLRLSITPGNDYIIGGNYGTGNSQDIAVLCLDDLGRVGFEKLFNGPNNLRDRLMDLTTDGNNIYISGRCKQSTTNSIEDNIALHYEYTDVPFSIGTMGANDPFPGLKYVPQETWLEFDKKCLKMTKINDKDFTYGQLIDFVNDSTCNKIENVLDPDHVLRIDAKKLPVRKVFFDLTEADSLSESRLGDMVKVPQFYCQLIVTLPAQVNPVTKNQYLRNIKPDIHFAQLNHVYELASPPPPPTNDPDYAVEQGALHPTTAWPNGHINVDSTWNVHVGTSSLRLGVYDSGIETNIADLPSSFLGYDFTTNTALWAGDTYNHGTPMAGIIGATRNNNIGVAGVAGGDASSSTPQVSMYDCKVCPYGACAESYFAPAVLKGAQGQNIGGYAFSVMNWSMRLNYAWSPYVWSNGVFAASLQQMQFANRNGVAVSASKGNLVGLGTWNFPSDWSKEITMSIGSSGNDGEYCKKPQNCTNGSTQWGNIDFVAPGTDTLIKTTDNLGNYIRYDGTSSAAAFISGASALLMGYRNTTTPSWDNMIHEDVENILRRSCWDLKDSINYPGEKTGYDSLTGWGRINAYKAMKAVNKNYYRFRHITEFVGNTGVSTNTAVVYSDTMTWKNYGSIATGVYNTEIIERTTTINYNLLPSEKIVDSWIMAKETYGTALDSIHMDYERPQFCKIVSVTNNQAVLKTFYYHRIGTNDYAPYMQPSVYRTAFTLYTYDSTGTVGIKKNPDLVNYAKFKVFPNPNNGEFQVSFVSDFDDVLTYKVTNILGQVVKTGTYRSTYGKNNIEINLEDAANGVYILNIFDKSKELHKQKIIKE